MGKRFGFLSAIEIELPQVELGISAAQTIREIFEVFLESSNSFFAVVLQILAFGSFIRCTFQLKVGYLNIS